MPATGVSLHGRALLPTPCHDEPVHLCGRAQVQRAHLPEMLGLCQNDK